MGVILAIVGFVFTYVSLGDLYESANKCLANNISCESVPEKTPLATVGGVALSIGAGIFWLGVWLGVALYVVKLIQNRKTKQH